ncbi:MAG: DUF1189 family protein [Candidatus Woesearchaeota archaeon]
MRFSEFLYIFSRAFNPGEYKNLVLRKKRDTINYFFLLLFFCIFLGLILSIPKLINVPNKIQSFFSNFEIINVSMDVKANEKIVVMDFPKIVMDFTGNYSYNDTKITDEFILITNSDIYTKKFRPSFSGFFQIENKSFDQYKNLKDDFSKIKNGTYWLIFLLMLPSAILFIYLFNLIKYVLIIFLFTILGFIFIKIKRKKPSLIHVWKTAVFSSTIIIFMDIVILPLFKFSIYLSLLSFLLYALLFVLSLMILCEKEITLKHKELDED